VGQRTDNACFFLAFMATQCTVARQLRWSIVTIADASARRIIFSGNVQGAGSYGRGAAGSLASAAQIGEMMTNIKFVVRVSHTGTRAPVYVQRIGKTPFQMTINRKLALNMAKFTTKAHANSIHNLDSTTKIDT